MFELAELCESTLSSRLFECTTCVRVLFFDCLHGSDHALS